MYLLDLRKRMLTLVVVHSVRVACRTEGRLDQTTVSRYALKLKMVSLDGLSLQGLAWMSMSLSEQMLHGWSSVYSYSSSMVRSTSCLHGV